MLMEMVAMYSGRFYANKPELAARRIEAIGYQVGHQLSERYTMERPRFSDHLEAIKFICKDFWSEVFKKQIDNLKTNHRGTFVLQDNKFRWLSRVSVDPSQEMETEDPSTPGESKAAQAVSMYLYFPCGIIRGVLSNLGIPCAVSADISSLPTCLILQQLESSGFIFQLGFMVSSKTASSVLRDVTKKPFAGFCLLRARLGIRCFIDTVALCLSLDLSQLSKLRAVPLPTFQIQSQRVLDKVASMECNKEEAVRAKNLAEEKMKTGDFVGALILVTKAQRLFPNLENIHQMIAICHVHSSANKKTDGLDEQNWYGILQVQPFADADTIKKQYRKLTLLLHPDKNKFAGAESAFKLVGEANMAKEILKRVLEEAHVDINKHRRRAEVVDEATRKLAHDCDRKHAEFQKHLDKAAKDLVLAFLHFIVAHGSHNNSTIINQEETTKLAFSVAHHKEAPTLFQSLGLDNMIPEFVQKLISTSTRQYIPAVRLICFFKLQGFDPSLVLYKEIEEDGEKLRDIFQLAANYKLKIDIPGDVVVKLMLESSGFIFQLGFMVSRKTGSSVLRDAQDKDGGKLGDILELLADYKLEIDIPGELIVKLVGQRLYQVQSSRVDRRNGRSN
ncbi:unnamed protein product [Arabis nemorensis]|uniref:FRIGIDA-like protein n=1 Tax=Arabis nemorensis TaxID=586526 RepID=A0A565B6W5_9BRAS|nr:unnamed protein product [Arabis nemorensis]